MKRDCVHFARGTNDSCGVHIFISPELDINTSLICEDDNGCFIALNATTVTNEECILYNVYNAPTKNNIQEQIY